MTLHAMCDAAMVCFFFFFFFFKQKTAYEIGTGDWSSDVCLPILYLGLVIFCGLEFMLFYIAWEKQIPEKFF